MKILKFKSGLMLAFALLSLCFSAWNLPANLQTAKPDSNVSSSYAATPGQQANSERFEVFSEDGLIKTLKMPDTAATPKISLSSASPSFNFEMVKLVDNGPDEEKVVLTFMGDGFKADEQEKFINAARESVNFLLNFHPFSSYKDKFNVYAIKVISNASGAGNSRSELIDNYFGSTFYADGITARALAVCYTAKAYELTNYYTPKCDMRVVLVNSTVYGGTGGSLAVSSLHPALKDIVAHELGHSFGGLADEYWPGAGVANAPNMTYDNSPNTVKWKSWLGFEEVGIYPFVESPSWYRPHQECAMQYLERPFCRVCATELTRLLSKTVNEGFYGQSDFKSAVVPGGTARIADYAYYGCEKLTEITIPCSVTSIGTYAFLRCDNLKSITNFAVTPQSVTGTTFGSLILSNITLMVPAGSKSAYLNAGWTGFKDIVEIATLTSIAIKNQPSKLNYLTDQALDLSGLEVTLKYSDNSTEDVKFADFAAKGITTSVTNGIPLSAAAHNNLKITVTNYNGQTADINQLTVNKAEAGSVTGTTKAVKTNNSITISAIVTPNSKQEIEYAISTAGTPPTSGWQTTLKWAKLRGNTTYYIFARYKDNDNYYEGAASLVSTVKTDVTPLPSWLLPVAIGGTAAVLICIAIVLIVRRKKHKMTR